MIVFYMSQIATKQSVLNTQLIRNLNKKLLNLLPIHKLYLTPQYTLRLQHF